MATKRMFSQTIIDSDAFIDMPLSTQSLYFHLSMRADDEGFVNNPKKIQRTIGCNDDDLKVLSAKGFIIPFDSGVIVIKHWKMHNYIRADRLKLTAYEDEKSMLITKENGSYSLDVSQMSGTCQAHVSIDKIRVGKNRLDNIYNQFGEFKNVLLTDDEIEKLKNKYSKEYKNKIEALSCYLANNKRKSYDNHYATILAWIRKENKIVNEEPEWLNEKQKKENINENDYKELEGLLKKYE